MPRSTISTSSTSTSTRHICSCSYISIHPAERFSEAHWNSRSVCAKMSKTQKQVDTTPEREQHERNFSQKAVLIFIAKKCPITQNSCIKILSFHAGNWPKVSAHTLRENDWRKSRREKRRNGWTSTMRESWILCTSLHYHLFWTMWLRLIHNIFTPAVPATFLAQSTCLVLHQWHLWGPEISQGVMHQKLVNPKFCQCQQASEAKPRLSGLSGARKRSRRRQRKKVDQKRKRSDDGSDWQKLSVQN